MLTILILFIKCMNIVFYSVFLVESQLSLHRYTILVTGILMILNKIFIEKLLIQQCKVLFYKGAKSKFIEKQDGYETLLLLDLYMERGRKLRDRKITNESTETILERLTKFVDMTTVAYTIESINILVLLIQLYLDRDTRIATISTLVSIYLVNKINKEISTCTTNLIVSSYGSNITKLKDKKFRKLIKERIKTIGGQKLIEIGNCSFTY